MSLKHINKIGKIKKPRVVIRKEKKKDPDDDGTVLRLGGKMEYEIDYIEDDKGHISYKVKLQVNVENNFIGMIMARDQLTALLKRDSLPTLPKNQKLSSKQVNDYLTAKLLLDDLCNGVAHHMYKEGMKQPVIVPVEQPKIILPE